MEVGTGKIGLRICEAERKVEIQLHAVHAVAGARASRNRETAIKACLHSPGRAGGWQRMERLALAGHTADAEGNPIKMNAQQVASMGFAEMRLLRAL